MKPDPRLSISYIGPSGAVEVLTISPQAAARRWPELFKVLAWDVAKEAGKLEAKQDRLPLIDG